MEGGQGQSRAPQVTACLSLQDHHLDPPCPLSGRAGPAALEGLYHLERGQAGAPALPKPHGRVPEQGGPQPPRRPHCPCLPLTPSLTAPYLHPAPSLSPNSTLTGPHPHCPLPACPTCTSSILTAPFLPTCPLVSCVLPRWPLSVTWMRTRSGRVSTATRTLRCVGHGTH